MPSVKQGGGYTLTFARKNYDVRDHLDKLKENKVVITDYLCEAVRFYEEHKNDDKLNKNGINNLDIEKLIEEKLKAMIDVSNLVNIDSKKNSKSLEDDIDNIDDTDLEED